MKKLSARKPSPAMVVALVALFVALSGTAVAAGVPALAKRALIADNAKKLGGQTAAQVAATPGPANSAASLVTTKSLPFSLAASAAVNFPISCDAGQKALGGGFVSAQPVISADTALSTDGATWTVLLWNLGAAPASGTYYVMCLK